MNTSALRKVIFTFKAAPGKKVFIAGSFSNWNPKVRSLT